MRLTFTSTTDEEIIKERLGLLLVPGPLHDPALDRTIARIADSFARYAGAYPLPLWAPHLLIDQEMRSLTEALFPLKEIERAFRHLLSRGCRFAPLLHATALGTASSWLDVLQGLHPLLEAADPAPALAALAADDCARRDFLFSLFLPRRYGASFERYPLQAEWLASWVRACAPSLRRRLRVLDCACGSGEGTWRVGEIIARCGTDLGACSVHGSTFEPIELFAAAHAFFPHDPQRQSGYRERIAPLLGGEMEVLFYLDDVGSEGEGDYDLILCNGLLGGPMLSERKEVAHVLAKLAGRLAKGGVLLAADRFHAGWKKRLPNDGLMELMTGCGLEPLPVPEGVGGRRGR
ncbi:chemotaxis protein CheR [Geomonas sp. RF6]|uniref:chemotaxis protein CheR n=1 Tax=Geomonas sp. RF6 TaxID=2897342 RepID=UPI001E2E1769|nr:chemotaxis protein CheR [Geomonas sp. RF6]UFS72242.1 chemotaxis protein CheR [Geomonas sp. RF6]